MQVNIQHISTTSRDKKKLQMDQSKHILYIYIYKYIDIIFICKILSGNLVCNIFDSPKTNMDTQNDALEKVAPFEYGHFWYLC